MNELGSWLVCFIKIRTCCVLFAGVCFTCLSQARTVDFPYEDAFDRGAGGAVLTRATQEGILISNPALLPYGGKLFRWLGTKLTVGPGVDSLDLVEKLANGSGGVEIEEGSEAQGASPLESLFGRPIHIGASAALSFFTNNGGVAVFANVEPDVKAWKRGDPVEGTGTPNVVIRNNTYAGAYLSGASRSLWDWLSFGVSAKYLLSSEGVVRIDMSDPDAAENVEQKVNDAGLSELSNGIGADAGMLMFFQGDYLDFRLAGTAVDIGNTKLSNGDELKQVIHGGLSLTLHSNKDAIHLSADLRDVQNAYKEPIYKRIYAGTKILIRSYIGLAAGIYHGSPSYGLELDFILFRLSATSFRKEYEESPGVDSRKIYLLSFTTGWDF